MDFEEQISTEEIIEKSKKGDEICMGAVAKFTEIYATQTSNLALTCLPYGGIYLTGGVTTGIAEFLKNDPLFVNTFLASKDDNEIMRNFPIFVVDGGVELGILGAL